MTDVNYKVEVDLPEDFVISMDFGTSHTCAVSSIKGNALKVMTMTIGIRYTSVKELPTFITFDEDVTILSVSAGDEHTCVVYDGEVFVGVVGDKQLGEYYEFDSSVVVAETFADTNGVL